MSTLPSYSIHAKRRQQRLGSLEFRYSPEVEADMFQWAGTQADNALQLTKEKIQMLGREASHQLTIDRLKAQMDEFMKKQRKREDDMLEQFRQLLNTKKLKIRGNVVSTDISGLLTIPM